MGDNQEFDARLTARRCTLKAPDYRQLTAIDWIVLDFTDGVHTFGALCNLLPASEAAIQQSYKHLRELGFITWQEGAHGAKGNEEQVIANVLQPTIGVRLNESEASRSPYLRTTQSGSSLFGSTLGPRPIGLMPSLTDYSDEVCRQYLPQHMIAEFRQFKPTLVDDKLDISVELQVFADFIYEHLSQMSARDLLGLDEEVTAHDQIRQAYQLRTKQFHPDRYFRKNISSFAPRIAAIYKAVTAAYTELQTR